MKRLFVVINENMLCSLAYAPMVNTPDVIGRSLTVLDVKSGAGQSRGTDVFLGDGDSIRFATKADTENFPTYAAATMALSSIAEPPVPTDELWDLFARLHYEFEQASKQFKELAAKVGVGSNHFKGQWPQLDSTAEGYSRECGKTKKYKDKLKPDHSYSDKAQQILRLLSEGMDKVFLSPLHAELVMSDEITDLCRADIPDGDDTWQIISYALMAYSWLATHHMHSRDVYLLYIRATCMNENLRSLYSKMKKIDSDCRLVQGLIFGTNNVSHHFGSTKTDWMSLIIAIRDSDALTSNASIITKKHRENVEKFKAEKPDLSIQA
ncbi:hypothetical protein [Aeromonas caviae]|uniref:hypothetical protein n=1 Tax=Aeromonas caviae TaxID=648 RepID=UPI003859C8CE